MKVALCGLLPQQQTRFLVMWPEVEFLFASSQEAPEKWARVAKAADILLCTRFMSHTKRNKIMTCKRPAVKAHFVSGIQEMEELLNELIRPRLAAAKSAR